MLIDKIRIAEPVSEKAHVALVQQLTGVIKDVSQKSETDNRKFAKGEAKIRELRLKA